MGQGSAGWPHIALIEAEHADYSPQIHELTTRYGDTWRTCVEPYQQTFDKKLFDSTR